MSAASYEQSRESSSKSFFKCCAPFITFMAPFMRNRSIRSIFAASYVALHDMLPYSPIPSHGWFQSQTVVYDSPLPSPKPLHLTRRDKEPVGPRTTVQRLHLYFTCLTQSPVFYCWRDLIRLSATVCLQ